MAVKIFWTSSAWKDLEGIAEFISKDSRFYAVSFVQQSTEASRSLQYLPRRGRIVPEFGNVNIRELFLMNYRMIYRISKSSVHIVALIHGSRDLWSLWKREGRI